MYTTILWATDGSAEADAALEEALELLEPGGTLVALHCDQRFVGGRVGGISVLPDELDRRRHIDEQVEALRAQGIDVEERIELTHRDPAHEIAAAANERGVELVVCGTRSLHGLPALLNGSVAAHLLKYVQVPVVVVPLGARASVAEVLR